MENTRVKELVNEINSFSYKDKKELYSQLFSTGYMGGDALDDKLVLVSLISLTYLKLKEKNNAVTPIQILEKITKEPKGTLMYQTLEALSILVEDLSYGHKTASSCGLKSSEEIINKIKELINTWIPF
jgi:hypothetical protein